MMLSAGVTFTGTINISPFEHIFGNQYVIVLILYNYFAIIFVTLRLWI
jgi:hypothetical protein